MLPDLETLAIVFERPEQLSLQRLTLNPPDITDVIVDVTWSGISAGTERLLWFGQMPDFPGMGYPLVPGYESIGKIIWAGEQSGLTVGQFVFVPGATCYGSVHGLFGGAASRIVVAGTRVFPIAESLEEKGILLTLAATAHHIFNYDGSDFKPPELIVGHGVLGRLLARLVALKTDVKPVVWEITSQRMEGSLGFDYQVLHPDQDLKNNYQVICDMSGDSMILDTLVNRLVRGGEIILGGFYHKPLKLTFPPAFLREVKIRIVAEFLPNDLTSIINLLNSEQSLLDNLITHKFSVTDALNAYQIAFTDPTCIKMALNWKY